MVSRVNMDEVWTARIVERKTIKTHAEIAVTGEASIALMSNLVLLSSLMPDSVSLNEVGDIASTGSCCSLHASAYSMILSAIADKENCPVEWVCIVDISIRYFQGCGLLTLDYNCPFGEVIFDISASASKLDLVCFEYLVMQLKLNLKCSTCGLLSNTVPLYRCGLCRRAYYCGEDCRTIHASQHKHECRIGRIACGYCNLLCKKSESSGRRKMCKGRVRYCNEECQKKDWANHKKFCKPCIQYNINKK